MMLVGTFPFNSFLAGILCSLSFFSLTGARAAGARGGRGERRRPRFPDGPLARLRPPRRRPTAPRLVLRHATPPPSRRPCSPTPVCLRMQIDPTNKDFTGISPERAFADFLLANSILFLAVFNYIG
jgi:hypothetical protein